MEARPNPVQQNAERNIYCPYYQGCLDFAAKKYWEYWACCECSHNQLKDPPQADLPTLTDDGEYHISPRIFA